MSYISTIIPTLNRPADLVSAVTSVLKQGHLPTELIVVDQSPDDRSYSAVMEVYDTFETTPKLVYLHDPKISGLVMAKKRGVEIAKGDLISFLEDDIVLHPNYFKNIVHIFGENKTTMGCCGVVSNIQSGSVYECLFKLFHRGIFYDPRLNLGKHRDCQGLGVLLPSRYLSGGISCYRKEVFESVKFDTDNDFFLLEDVDFSTRAANFFGNECFFISTNLCLAHNMSPINRLTLHANWQRKVREYIVFYKKNNSESFALFNLIWLLLGLWGGSLFLSIYFKSLHPFLGFVSGLFRGVYQTVVFE